MRCCKACSCALIRDQHLIHHCGCVYRIFAISTGSIPIHSRPEIAVRRYPPISRGCPYRQHPRTVPWKVARRILPLIPRRGHQHHSSTHRRVHRGLQVRGAWSFPGERHGDDACWLLVDLHAVDHSARGPDDGVGDVVGEPRAAPTEDAEDKHGGLWRDLVHHRRHAGAVPGG